MSSFHLKHPLLGTLALASVVSVALWANLAPTTLGYASGEYADLAAQEEQPPELQNQQMATVADNTASSTNQADSDSAPCTWSQDSGSTSSTAASQSVSISSSSSVSSGDQTFPITVPTATEVQPGAGAPAAPVLRSATFQLCTPSDPEAERAIEQLIAGHGFNASLVSQADGCVALTIRVSPSTSTGRASTMLTVSSGGSGGKAPLTFSIQIVSENGATHVSIGSGR